MKSARPRTHVRESARLRRLEMIEAALRVMRRDGLRAITHRAVAAEAGVPLSATTYYFRDLEDLITESFLHWAATQHHVVQAFHARALDLAGEASASGMAPQGLAARLADATADYVAEQVGVYRGDRVLELAFLHEAVRLPRLREAVALQQEQQLRMLTGFHAALGSRQPEADAQISNSLLLGLEKGALLAGTETIDRSGIRAVLLRYLQAVLEPDPEGRDRKRGQGASGRTSRPGVAPGGRPLAKSPRRARGGKKPLSGPA